MSKTTSVEWRKTFLYQVYVRSHTAEGTFKAFNKDLDRISQLGVDVVYFMPIHPIGQLHKKGGLGCPYSIQDYKEINPEYGTMDDFEHTVREIHNRNMKVMIDVVFNHTSHDSVLLQEHPEYFMHDENGNLTSKEPHWSDIQDFDFANDKGLWDELIDTLLFWQKKGVDGFRFDVASFLPLDFLHQAREAMMAFNPNVMLLSESVHGHYLRHMRNRGFRILSEAEIYQVFDMAYDYDVHSYYEAYLKGNEQLNTYLKEVLRQEEIYPQNYIKMRNLENHDFGRFTKMVDSNPIKVDNWTGFIFFVKGSTMIYAGEEFSDTHQPSLFDKEDVNWTGRDISPLIRKLATLTKMDHFANGVFDIHLQEKDVIVSSYRYNNETIVGIFNVGDESGTVSINLPDGIYEDLLSSKQIQVQDNTVILSKEPIIFAV
jgi:glycosidase